MINELEVCNIAEAIQTDTNAYDEVIILFFPKDGFDIFVDHDAGLRTHLILTILVSFSHAAEILALFIEESKSLIEWEVFFFLIHYLFDALVCIVLINISL